jgi:hypothetical protein
MMKVYVSYVIQDKGGHIHDSTFLNHDAPIIFCSLNPHTTDVMEWANNEQSKLKQNQNLIITSMYKL